VVVAYCYGLSPAVRVCRERRNVAGVAVVNPALYPAFLALAPQKRSLSHRVQTLRAAVRLLPRRSLYLLRFGRAESWWAKQTDERKPREELEELARTVPTWIYASASDYCVEPVQSILASLDGSGAVELELNDSVDMRDARTPEAQDALVDGIAAYIHRCVSHTSAAT
jgi:hypothetical protein